MHKHLHCGFWPKLLCSLAQTTLILFMTVTPPALAQNVLRGQIEEQEQRQQPPLQQQQPQLQQQQPPAPSVNLQSGVNTSAPTTPAKSCNCQYIDYIDKIVERNTGRIIFRVDKPMIPSQMLELALKKGISLRNASLKNLFLCHATLDGCDFTGCDLTCTNLSLSSLNDCNFSNAVISNTRFTYSSMRRVKFPDVQISNCLFEQCNMQHSMLDGSTFQNCNLVMASLSNSSMQNCNIDHTVWARINAHHINFQHSRLIGSESTGADFSGSNFAGAVLQNDGLVQASFLDCNISQTRWEAVKVTWAVINSQTLMAQAILDGQPFTQHVNDIEILLRNDTHPDYSRDEM